MAVVIPCYKAKDTIERAVRSVMDQTQLPAQVIVVDDHSDDPATELALDRLSAKFPEVQVVSLPRNVGPGGARNAGMARATQEYIAFLDADDIWLPEKIETQIRQMKRPGAAPICGHHLVLNSRAKTPLFDPGIVATSKAAKSLLFRNPLGTPTVMMRADVPFRFDPDRRYCEDYELWLKIAFSHGSFDFIDLPLAQRFKSAFGEAGLSANLRLMERAQTEVLQGARKDGRVSLPLYLLAIAWSKVKYVRRIGIAWIEARKRAAQ